MAAFADPSTKTLFISIVAMIFIVPCVLSEKLGGEAHSIDSYWNAKFSGLYSPVHSLDELKDTREQNFFHGIKYHSILDAFSKKGQPTLSNSSKPSNSDDGVIINGDPQGTDPLDLVGTYAEFKTKLDQRLLWGTYKGHLLHVITQRSPKPVTYGVMGQFNVMSRQLWHSYRNVQDNRGIYNYDYHDGEKFAHSTLKMQSDMFDFNFLKESSTAEKQKWHSFVGNPKKNEDELASLIFYMILEDFEPEKRNENKRLSYDSEARRIDVFDENGNITEYFKFTFYKDGAVDHVSNILLSHEVRKLPKNDNWRIKGNLERYLQGDSESLNLNRFSNTVEQDATMVAIQFIFDKSHDIVVQVTHNTDLAEKDEEKPLSDWLVALQAQKNHFEEKLNTSFMKNSNSSSKEPCVRQAISNLVAGISYYYGDIEVHGTNPRTKLPLFTGTPSKIKFPRGFLWDEGFHDSVICRWNHHICMDILDSYLNTQFESGWIPREQARGAESKDSAVLEYLTQNPEEGNPPTLILTVDYLIQLIRRDSPDSELLTEYLKMVYPKLKKWFDWWKHSYDGLSYKWYEDHRQMLMGSGLDNYPRQTHGRKTKYNLDLHSWMTWFADSLSGFAEMLGEEETKDLKQKKKSLHDALAKFRTPDGIYQEILTGSSFQGTSYTDHFGYINLFPFFFGLGSEGDLEKLISKIKEHNSIWTNYGLASLSKNDPQYRRGEIYWNGPIWININYLMLRGLRLYYGQSKIAQDFYEELRHGLVENVCKCRDEKKYFFEVYDERDGHGDEAHQYPFTGWTTLIANIIAENY